ncbi:type II toxin-antitoxin system VapC family toxin [Thermodesulfobacteriota bacterium]
MQQKIIIDTNIYIDIFNKGLHVNLRNPFQYIVFLAYPVLHELWMGAKGSKEIKHLTALQNEFIKLKRLIVPTVPTLVIIGKACQKFRISAKLDPIHPKHYNDISIAALAHQIGATVMTHNIQDFRIIKRAIDFNFEKT